MSPSDRDAVVPETWRKMEHLPQFAVCPLCSAVCDQSGVSGHAEYHAELNNVLKLLTDAVTVKEQTGFHKGKA